MTSISTTTVVAATTKPVSAPALQPDHVSLPAKPKWQKYLTPALVLLLTAGVVATISWKWNAWEGGKIEAEVMLVYPV